MSSWTLVVVAGVGFERNYHPVPIPSNGLCIGRAPQASAEGRQPLQILDDRLSRAHAVLVPDGRGSLVVLDLGSTNGTFIDHEKLVDERRVIDSGSVVRLGGVVGTLIKGEALLPGTSSRSKDLQEWTGVGPSSTALFQAFDELPKLGPFWIDCEHEEAGMIWVRALCKDRGRDLVLSEPEGPDREKRFWLRITRDPTFRPNRARNEIVLNVRDGESLSPPSGCAALKVPSLHERREDLMLSVCAGLMRRRGEEVLCSSAAAHRLLLHDWSGGIAELSRVLDQVASHLRPTEELDEMALEFSGVASLPDFGEREGANESLEDSLVRLLTANAGSVRKTAVDLGVDRTQVYRWLKKFDLNADSFRGL